MSALNPAKPDNRPLWRHSIHHPPADPQQRLTRVHAAIEQRCQFLESAQRMSRWMR